MSRDERFIGPIFDELGVRFLLVYNPKLKAFHYLLDETVTPNESFTPSPSTDRILIGKRTGFAFYRDHKLNRKILIGVFEGNSRVNNYYDGPFDQLPDNFIDGNSLHDAILDVAPYLKGRIDRYGSSFDGETRYMVAPYTQYSVEDDLMMFHRCATSKDVPADQYHLCFVYDESEDDAQNAPAASSQPAPQAAARGRRRPRRRASEETHRPAPPPWLPGLDVTSGVIVGRPQRERRTFRMTEGGSRCREFVSSPWPRRWSRSVLPRSTRRRRRKLRKKARSRPRKKAKRPQIETTKVDGTDNVYIFRNGNHQAMFVVTATA